MSTTEVAPLTLAELDASRIRDVTAASIRAAMAQELELLRQQFAAGKPVDALLAERARIVDRLLRSLWHRFEMDRTPHALLAVGGYGRGELYPCSDVDIAIVLAAEPDAETRGRIEALLAFLFDIRLDIGHSVRTVAESADAACGDITIATALMEARLITGAVPVFRGLQQAVSPPRVWPVEEFFQAKLDEQRDRHAKADDAIQRLEPNVKESPGGLRDIQVIAWATNRHFQAPNLHGLVTNGFMTEQEFAALDAGRRFLAEIRCTLHFAAGRREDRLLFDFQKLVAAKFGYPEDGSNRPVEEFMKRYYRTVRELSLLNEMLLGLFQQAILEVGKPSLIEPINRRFQIHNNAIEATGQNVFIHRPTALLEVFYLLQRHPDIQGVRASTIRLIRENVHLIDQSFRDDIRAKSLFMEIFRQPRRVGNELQRMHRYGVLERYLPAFQKITGLMQFDLFHIYTVDEHVLFVIRNVRYCLFPERDAAVSQQCQQTIQRIPKLELLYLAALFHDIAKGRNGDHSKLGALEAIAFCKAHGLSHFDTQLVAWLVNHHLVMSLTAQRKDISDPAVIQEFADLVRDQVRLDYLYLLTVADIRGTNPQLWTTWKETLLNQLHRGTAAMLRRDIAREPFRAERMPDAKAAALELLAPSAFAEAEIRTIWNAVGEEYFYRHLPDEIAWHTAAILEHGVSITPLVRIRNFENRGGTSIFIYMANVDNLFANTAQVLDRLGLTIQDARIITTAGGYVLDTFIVLEAESGRPVEGHGRYEEIAQWLRSTLTTGRLPQPRLRPAARRLKHFSIPTEVEFSEQPGSPLTLMSVVATDRPGFLSIVGRAMQYCRVRLHNARIATFGERVEDSFYITDLDDVPVTDPEVRRCLIERIESALAQE
ncbi:MAG: [protein-PII] uridylyltransferase [Gammaproteobacteria bacterium]|nr:[protein-PII] uridylyltransferase [Gammaproteobacteria bacterium]